VSTSTIERQRETIRSGLRRRMLARAGFDPRVAGRAYNRAADPTTPPAPGNGMDPERMVIPTGQAELEAMLTDSAKMQKVFADRNGAFGEFVTNYARAVHNRDLSIATQVKEQTEAILANWLRENQPDGVERIDLTPKAVVQTGNARNHLHNPKAMGAVLDREFKNSAEYFQTIWHNANRTADMQAKLTRVRNAFSSTVPSEGGFLIPEVLRSELLAVALENSVVRKRARVIPMDTLRVPFPAIDATSNVSSVYGGVVGYWTEEGAALTASQASFSRIVLDAKKLTAYTEVPNELISDSAISFQAYLDQIFPEALSFYEDIAFIKGSGVGEPLGALSDTNGAMIVVDKESGQAAGTIVWENIVKMYTRMLPSSIDRAVWVVSHDTFSELATMALSVGTGGSAIWLNNGAAGPPMTILGLPVVKSEKTPGILGTQGDISLVDFGFYLIGDRQVMSAMSSPHFKFQNDQTAYRIIQRVDGRPWLQSAITPQNNGPTLSAFVQLQTRA
jgi:HK97 family phage major capsid protein